MGSTLRGYSVRHSLGAPLMEPVQQRCPCVALTSHTEARCRQRGIRTAVLNLILTNADRDCCLRGGAYAWSISRACIAKLRSVGVSPSLLDRASRMVVVVGGDGAVITVVNHRSWFGRFHYGAEPMSPRRSLHGRRGMSRSRH